MNFMLKNIQTNFACKWMQKRTCFDGNETLIPEMIFCCNELFHYILIKNLNDTCALFSNKTSYIALSTSKEPPRGIFIT